MSFIGAAAVTSRASIAGAGGGTTPTPEGEPGVQILTNSKLNGDDTASAYDYEQSLVGDGAIVFSSAVTADHRKAQFSATGSNRAILKQTFNIVSGLTYTFSIYCTAIDDATSADAVFLNHYPFGSADPIGGAESRPTLGDAIADTRFSYSVVARTTGQLELQIGFIGEGDITLERVMVDQSDMLRNYTASDEAAPPEEPVELFLPYFGEWMGQIKCATTGNNTTKTNDSARRGYKLRAPAACTVTRMQFQVGTNFTGEGALPQQKSRLNNVDDHGYPAVFPMTWAVYPSDNGLTISGSALDSGSVEATNVNGGQGATGHSRMLCTIDCDYALTAGQQAILALTNSSTPSATYWSLNADAQVNSAWRTSPLSDGPFFGSDFLVVRETSAGSGVFAPTNGMLTGIACFTDAGWEFGCSHMDSTASGLQYNIGGGNRARQYIRPQRSGSIDRVLAAFWKTGSGTTNALTVLVTGPGVSSTINIPASEFPAASTALDPAVYSITPFSVVAGSDYLVEVHSSTSHASAYAGTARRNNTKLFLATTTTNQNPAPSGGVVRASQHGWGTPFDGTGQQSANGGSTWTFLGYPAGGSDISIGFGFA